MILHELDSGKSLDNITASQLQELSERWPCVFIGEEGIEEGIFFPEWKLEGKETLIYLLPCIRDCIPWFYLPLVIALTLYEVGSSTSNFVDEETEAQEV